MSMFACMLEWCAIVNFIERFQGLLGTVIGLILGSWMIMRSHYKAQSRRESIRMMINRIDNYVEKGEVYWHKRLSVSSDDELTAMAIKIQTEFVYFDVAFQSLMKNEDKEWKNMLREFFDATTGDVFARKTKIDKDMYGTKIANIHKKAIILKGFLLKHL